MEAGRVRQDPIRYDVNNRLVEVQYPNPLGIEGKEQPYERFAYDLAGNRITRMTESLTEQYRYDSYSRPVERRTAFRNGEREEEASVYTYDRQERHYFYTPSGRIERIMDSADEQGCGRKYIPIRFTYDKSGNLTAIRTK